MQLNRIIKLEQKEMNELEEIKHNLEMNYKGKTSLLDWVNKKLQEAFDFGYSERGNHETK